MSDQPYAIWDLEELQWLQSLAEHIDSSPYPDVPKEDAGPAAIIRLEVRVIQAQGGEVVAEIVKHLDGANSSLADVRIFSEPK